MATIVVIYDSLTGNTEQMARAIAEGIERNGSVKSVLKKLGEPFSLSILLEAKGVVFGSPVHYAYVTQMMREFIRNLEEETKAGKLNLKGKIGAVFGSYGWDGGVAIERFEKVVSSLGLEVQPAFHMKIDLQPILSMRARSLEECSNFGSQLSKKVSLKL